MNGANATREQIRQFVTSHFPLARQSPITDEDSLLVKGIIDSMGVLDLVNFVADKFNISIADEELLPENFESIKNLTFFVEQKQARLRKTA